MSQRIQRFLQFQKYSEKKKGSGNTKNFVFENSSKVYFGEGCVKEYLSCILSACGDTVMLCYGGGSIKKNGIYDEVITILKKVNNK